MRGLVYWVGDPWFVTNHEIRLGYSLTFNPAVKSVMVAALGR